MIPFCLSDEKDGFHKRKISIPWAEQSQEALTLLRTLLKQLMIRHSKSQTNLLTARPILELPSQTTEYRPVTISTSERGVLAFLEAVGRRMNAALAAASDADREPRVRMDLLLRLMRSACISTVLVNGGGGCTSELPKLNRLLRDLLGATGVVGAGSGNFGGGVGGSAAGEEAARMIRKMTASEAYNSVMQVRVQSIALALS